MTQSVRLGLDEAGSHALFRFAGVLNGRSVMEVPLLEELDVAPFQEPTPPVDEKRIQCSMWPQDVRNAMATTVVRGSSGYELIETMNQDNVCLLHVRLQCSSRRNGESVPKNREL